MPVIKVRLSYLVSGDKVHRIQRFQGMIWSDVPCKYTITKNRYKWSENNVDIPNQGSSFKQFCSV